MMILHNTSFHLKYASSDIDELAVSYRVVMVSSWPIKSLNTSALMGFGSGL